MRVKITQKVVERIGNANFSLVPKKLALRGAPQWRACKFLMPDSEPIFIEDGNSAVGVDASVFPDMPSELTLMDRAGKEIRLR